MSIGPVLFQVGGLVLLNLFALVLVLLRGPVYGTKVYRPMLLNIGLSVAPTVILGLTMATFGAAIYFESSLLIWLAIVLGGLTWLLMLPNSAYLITELNLSHRRKEETVPIWYDIVLVLALAMSGTLNALTNVAFVQVMAFALFTPNHDLFGSGWPWLAALGTMLLIAFGMYLGRNIRFNSWDLLHPASFIRKLSKHFGKRGEIGRCFGFVLLHAILLGLLYSIIVVPLMFQLFVTPV